MEVTAAVTLAMVVALVSLTRDLSTALSTRGWTVMQVLTDAYMTPGDSA